MSTTNARPPYNLPTSTAPIDPSLAQYKVKTDCDRSESLQGQFPTSFISRDVSQPAFQYNASLCILDTSPPQTQSTIVSSPPHILQSTGLQSETSAASVESSSKENTSSAPFPLVDEAPSNILEKAGLLVRSSSVGSAYSGAHSRSRVNSLSPGSAISSPGVGPLADISPLPSPFALSASPGLWERAVEGNLEQPTSLTSTSTATMEAPAELNVLASTSPKKRRLPLGLASSGSDAYGIDSQISARNESSHTRNRSTSEYVPEPMQAFRSRNIVVSGSVMPPKVAPQSPPIDYLHREHYLAVQRGITVPIARPPSPPKSNRETDSSDPESPPTSPSIPPSTPLRYEATMIRNNQLRSWRAIRQLGKGTFSTVMLATTIGENTKNIVNLANATVESPSQEERNPDPKSLVAVKICEHGPAGGVDEKKIELSLRRELEILKSIEHPSLVHLKAVNIMEQRALLVLNYCAGGDLFDLAVSKPDLLVHGLIRRIFTELVAAVQYLHGQYIVHRDIKLENILVNLPIDRLSTNDNWQSYPFPVVTLTDLGLGRWIPKPPASPLLDTRCGSEDYAAPELLMGQEYDGRATDAWALGVTLYSIMEGRLPFDPIPGARRKSPPKHRIARCEWSWVKFADSESEWDPVKGKELDGAREVVEGLLTRLRNRWSLEKVVQTEWVRGGIAIDGGLRRNEDDDEPS